MLVVIGLGLVSQYQQVAEVHEKVKLLGREMSTKKRPLCEACEHFILSPSSGWRCSHLDHYIEDDRAMRYHSATCGAYKFNATGRGNQ